MSTVPPASGSAIDRIWKFFASITLAVVVFTLISVTSIIGTIVEQQAAPERNIKLLTKLVGADAAPGLLKILDTLGFTNMYRSWWFLALLFIFAANLIICSIERLPSRWKMAREQIAPLGPEQGAHMPIQRHFTLEDKPEKARESVTGLLKGLGLSVLVRETDEGVQICGERGRYSRIGVYVTHLSILLIMAGAVAGIFLGFNASLNLLEGTSSAVAYQRNGTEIPLGFEIRCDDFDVSFYDNSDTPRAYRSWLTILEGGKEVVKQEIEVNTPLRYRGITFYQSSYGFSPTKDSLFKFSLSSGDGTRKDVQVRFGESFAMPGGKVSGTVSDFSPALGIDNKGRLFTYADMMNNPAVLVEFSDGGKPLYQQWVLKRYPETWVTKDGMVEFKDLWGSQYTGL